MAVARHCSRNSPLPFSIPFSFSLFLCVVDVREWWIEGRLGGARGGWIQKVQNFAVIGLLLLDAGLHDVGLYNSPGYFEF